MPINKNSAIVIDAYEGNGKWHPNLATERFDAFIAQSNRGLHKDAEFPRSYETCVQHGVPFMAYNQFVAAVDWKQQSDVQLAIVAGRPEVRRLWLAYDSAGLNAGKLNAKTAKDALSAVKYQRSEHQRVGFYGNRSDIQQLYKDAPAARLFPLWVARYPLSQFWWNNTADTKPQNAPPAWKTDVWNYWLWQFASERNWLGHAAGHDYGFPQSWSVDVNAWNGTKENMLAKLGL